MNVIFCRSHGVGGWIIRLLTFSKWNHVGLEYNGRVIDATVENGVSESSLYDFKNRYDKTQSIAVRDVNQFAAWNFAKKQIGKKYDWAAIVALPFRENWQSGKSWFCSELVSASLAAGGKALRVPTGRVTPRDLWVSL